MACARPGCRKGRRRRIEWAGRGGKAGPKIGVSIAEAVSGINPLDQGMGRELAIPSAGVKDRADGLAEDRFLALIALSSADPEGQLRVEFTCPRYHSANVCYLRAP